MGREDALQKIKKLSEVGIDRQKKTIRILEESPEGTIAQLSNLQKGNYGEMKMDIFYDELGYDRISLDRVTELDAPAHRGIDGVYYKKGPPPEYIIGEAKYGTSSLTKNLADGTNQMDDNWIAIRMENAVGAEMYEKYLTDIILYPSCRKDILFHINSDCTVGEPIMLIDGIPRR